MPNRPLTPDEASAMADSMMANNSYWDGSPAAKSSEADRASAEADKMMAGNQFWDYQPGQAAPPPKPMGMGGSMRPGPGQLAKRQPTAEELKAVADAMTMMAGMEQSKKAGPATSPMLAHTAPGNQSYWLPMQDKMAGAKSPAKPKAKKKSEDDEDEDY